MMTTFKTKFWQNAQIWKSRVSEFLMKSQSRSFNQVSVSKVTLSTASLVQTNTKIVSSLITSNVLQLQFLCIFRSFQNLQQTLI